MKQDNDYKKRELLIEAAKKEFLEKGYNKASLRAICADAGVTTGALYFFFENKEDLFSAIVDPVLLGLKGIILDHAREEDELVKKVDLLGSVDPFKNIDLDHSGIVDRLVDFIYQNYDIVMMLLTSSENTAYANIVDQFVELMEEVTPDKVAKLNGLKYDRYMSHWMTHVAIDAFIQMIKHETDKEKARERLVKIMNYLVKGWVELVFEIER